jgi:diguanylate cyclase (GGDEF)-like protein/putative nucleotidyltransferase with HDIG domain
VWAAGGWAASTGYFIAVRHGSERELLLGSLLGHVLACSAAAALFFVFTAFPTEFLLVTLPLSVTGSLFYHAHIHRLSQKTRELADASRLHLATVEALASAIDARDRVDVGHVRRTQIYAVGIGKALGLSEGELNALRAGALLHDIGKLAVPEHILNKPGRLTPAELEKTKIHVNVGASILEKVGFPYPVVPTVRHHHERWDGSGYPEGLRGDEIPLTARILSVADAFDALRGARPYRSAVGRDDACNFLRSRAGTQFDPHVVSTFLRHLKQLEAEIDLLGFRYQTASELTESAGNFPANRPDYAEQIKRANQEVFSLYEMARDLGAAQNLDETLSLLSRKVGEFVPYDTCLVYLLDDDKKHAHAAHVEGRNSGLLAGNRIALGEGASGYVLKKRKPVENVAPSLDFAFSHPEICEHYLAMASVPLFADDELVGAVSLFSGELLVYEEEHLRLLETICKIAGDAISKSIRNAENEIQALTDALTGLPNARSLQNFFEKETARASRGGTSLQLMVLDLDGFKAVNDTLGHKAGDKLLREISRIIRSELRDYDLLARYGGDEFVALVPETENSDVAELCTRIEAAVDAYADRTDGPRVGVSIGSACYPTQGETFEQLLIVADEAMYRTKASRKQRRMHGAVAEGDGRNAGYVSPGGGGSEDLFAKDMIVELDESHIVSVNSIN